MKNKRAKIKGHSHLIRHPLSGAILNTNKEEIARFQRERDMETRLNTIEEKMDMILDFFEKRLGE